MLIRLMTTLLYLIKSMGAVRLCYRKPTACLLTFATFCHPAPGHPPVNLWRVGLACAPQGERLVVQKGKLPYGRLAERCWETYTTVMRPYGTEIFFKARDKKFMQNQVDFNTYQQESRKTWNLVQTDHPIVYPTLGLLNEAGEVAGKIKKIFRDKQGQISAADREALKQELGDVLWYLAQIATELDLTLEEVAAANLTKLFSRLERGKIQGDGDNR